MSTLPAPRINNGGIDNEYVDIEYNDDLENLPYYVVIPLAAVVFITVVLIVICVRSRQMSIEPRPPAVDIEEAQSDVRNWERQVAREYVGNIRRLSGSDNPAFQRDCAAPSSSLATRTDVFPKVQRSSEMKITDSGHGNKQALMPPRENGLPSSAPSAFETKYRLPPGGGEKIPDRTLTRLNLNREATQRASMDDEQKSVQSYASHSRIANLANSPTFRKLKHGASNATLKRRKKYDLCHVHDNEHRTDPTNAIQAVDSGSNPHLNSFRPLNTELSSANHQKQNIDIRTFDRNNSKYQTLDMGIKGFRRGHRRKEVEQEWARKNHLTISKRNKHVSRRSSLASNGSIRSSFRSPVSRRISRRYNSNWSLDTDIESQRPQNPFHPSPYKLQFQNSMRPKRNVEYRQGIRTKRRSTLLSVKSIKVRHNHNSDEEKNVFDSESFYMGFDIPLPPTATTKPLVEQNKLIKNNNVNVEKTPSRNVNVHANIHSSPENTSDHLGVEQRSVSVRSDHPYEEIEFVGDNRETIQQSNGETDPISG